MNPRSLVRLLLETTSHADQNVARLLANNTDDFMDAMRSGQVDNFLRGSNEGRALLNNPEFMRMTTKISGNLDYITRAGGDLAAGRQMNAAEFLTRMDIPATSGSARALTQGIESFNQAAARGANLVSGNADAIAAARRTRAPRTPDISADELAARLQRARTGGDDAARASANTADTAAGPSIRSADNAAGVADDVAEAAVETGARATNTLSRRQTYRLLEGKESIADKLTILSRNGRDDLFDRVLLQARKNGLSAGDNSVIQLRKDLPEALRERVQEIFTLQSTGSRFARAADSLRATFSLENAKGILSGAASHPFKSAYDLFAQQWRVPFGTLKWAGQHKAAAGVISATGIGTFSGLDMATNGVSTDIAATATRGIVGTYIAADKAVLSAGGAVLGAGLNLVTTDGAEKLADAAGDATYSAATNSPGMFNRFLNRATGGKPDEVMDYVSNIPFVGMLLPGPVRTARNVNRLTEAANGSNGETDVPVDPADRAADVAGAVTGAAGTAADTAQSALDSVSLANAMRNPEQAWNSLQQFAANNPTMRRAMEIGEQNPFLKWGLIGGFAMGALSNGTPLERISNGLKSALMFGVMLDLLGGLFGKPSLIMGGIGNMLSGRSSTPQPTLTEGMERELGITPTAPGATSGATPGTTPTATVPGADPLTTIPEATTATAPANITSNFTAQAKPPVQPNLSANQQAWNSAGQQPATPTTTLIAPATNDQRYHRDMPLSPTPMSAG
ncbi:MAG: hypothetical protein ACXW4B_11395 [Micavibrio sp.]